MPWLRQTVPPLSSSKPAKVFVKGVSLRTDRTRNTASCTMPQSPGSQSFMGRKVPSTGSQTKKLQNHALEHGKRNPSKPGSPKHPVGGLGFRALYPKPGYHTESGPESDPKTPSPMLAKTKKCRSPETPKSTSQASGVTCSIVLTGFRSSGVSILIWLL